MHLSTADHSGSVTGVSDFPIGNCQSTDFYTEFIFSQRHIILEWQITGRYLGLCHKFWQKTSTTLGGLSLSFNGYQIFLYLCPSPSPIIRCIFLDRSLWHSTNKHGNRSDPAPHKKLPNALGRFELFKGMIKAERSEWKGSYWHQWALEQAWCVDS